MGKLLKPRHAVDVFRVRYWYTGVMRELKFDTAYQAERQIEPEHFHVQDLRTVYPGKWRRYAVGENTPQKKLVMAVDLLAKGSAYELFHPLWLILKKLSSEKFKAESYLRLLNPAIQSIVMRSGTDRLGAPLVWIPYSNFKADVLLRRGTLDALAVLVLYWHRAKMQDDREQTEAVAIAIYHMLLIIGWDIRNRQLHRELFSLFRTEIFDKTDWKDGLFATDSKTFELSICLLHQGAGADPDKEGMNIAVWKKENRRIQALLAGKKGFDIRFAMKPLCAPAWQFGPPSQHNLNHWAVARGYWAWGWDCILNGQNGTFPDRDVRISDPDFNRLLTQQRYVLAWFNDRPGFLSLGTESKKQNIT